MTYGFVVFYRFKPMGREEAEKSRETWRRVRTEIWPKDLKIVGDYRHAWGTEWNGFLVLECDNPQVFFEFWPVFREETRWYLDNTQTVIGVKTDPDEWGSLSR
ncbi:MAG: hypothetical protein ACTSVD_05690 [Candidatus Thorarchaeota archaeon]|nr:MAG: hypothetical protein DRO73_06085 [Candidatus Thorarchaeota archaeon]RLI61407.1 MAG: hypothetical protein DRO93_04385 [Candidatus Thorarchaeota archaeon]